jgi:hypothetical protein
MGDPRTAPVGQIKSFPFGKEIPNRDRVPDRYRLSNILNNDCMVKWFVALTFWHFSILNHKVLSSSLSTFIHFGPHIFHFCGSAQTVPAFEAIVKVTNNYVCVHLD